MKSETNKTGNAKKTFKLWKKPSWRTVLFLVLVAAAAAAVACWGGFRMLVAAQDISQLDKPLPAATIWYDRNGKEVERLSRREIIAVEYGVLPQSLIDAVTAVEDKRFFDHKGMDLRAIGRAVYVNLKAGGAAQGGSTITQQLAKNVFLTNERTWTRKWNEILLAKKIEESYDKRNIMEMYLNQIYFGEGAWGIQRAAETYFGKEADKLTLSESAMLAGLIRAPSALTPYKHPEKAKDRRNLVLRLMEEQGKITSSDYHAAILEPIKLSAAAESNDPSSMKYPYYVDQMIREAVAKYGLTENEVLRGGLHIYTALDTRMQQAAEQVYADESLFPESQPDQLIQSGAVLVDPRDGGIRALIGGRGNQPFRGFNRASQLKRQPGSAMKPIAVYAPALERGYGPGDTLIDEPIDFGGYRPKNADGRYHGAVSLYEALIRSYNTPAVKLLYEIGIDAGLDASARFGLSLANEDRTLALALGGLQEGVSPLAMAEAYGTFANDGSRMPAHTIERIESADGVVIVDASKQAPVKVIEPEIARTMTAMLEGVVQEGSGQAAALPGRPVAGKTGTTEMPGADSGVKDNWFVGFTPQLVGSVWLGYDQTDSGHYLTTTSKAAAAVFRALMVEALEDEPVIAFQPAKGLKSKDMKIRNDSDDDNKWGKPKEKGKDKKKDKERYDKKKEKERKKAEKRNKKRTKWQEQSWQY